MPHMITAIILKGAYKPEELTYFDLRPVPLNNELTLFHIDTTYSAYWQFYLGRAGELPLFRRPSLPFPREIVLAEIVERISVSTKPHFAIIATDYFGGIGTQYANAFIGSENVDPEMEKINQALRFLGVSAERGKDEFDTVGLSDIRSTPEYLEKYRDLAEEHDLDC